MDQPGVGLLGLILRSRSAGKSSWFLQQENFIMFLFLQFGCLEAFLDAVWSVVIKVDSLKYAHSHIA